LPDNWIVAILN